MSKIKSVTVTIDEEGTELILEIEDARKLYMALAEIFSPAVNIVSPSITSEPYTYTSGIKYTTAGDAASITLGGTESGISRLRD